MATGMQTTSFLPADFAKKSFAAAIARYMPNGQAPLFGMTAMLDSEPAVQTTHGYWTKTMIFPEATTSSSALAGDTTIPVVSSASLLPGMILRVESTKENIIVNTVPNGTSITATRGIGTVAAAAIGSGAKLYQVGNAFEEGSVRPNAMNINPVQITNLTQIFRNTWAITDTMRQVMTVAGDGNSAESKQECAAFHAADIEKALFFGQKYSGTRNGMPFRTMDGLISIVGNLSYYPSSYASANVTVAGSTTNFTQLETMLDPCFNQTTDAMTANERVIFCGGSAKKVLNNIGRLNGQYQLVDGQTSYGLQFATFKIARGTFRMIEHPLFNTNADWSKMAVAVDLSSFRLAYLGDRKTQYKGFNEAGKEAQDNGIDAVGGTLTTEVTALVKNPPANAVIYNLTAAAQG